MSHNVSVLKPIEAFRFGLHVVDTREKTARGKYLIGSIYNICLRLWYRILAVLSDGKQSQRTISDVSLSVIESCMQKK